MTAVLLELKTKVCLQLFLIFFRNDCRVVIRPDVLLFLQKVPERRCGTGKLGLLCCLRHRQPGKEKLKILPQSTRFPFVDQRLAAFYPIPVWNS